jgi:5'-deoxynucleotidase YfbR-like HD superfamily hydrolase
MMMTTTTPANARQKRAIVLLPSGGQLDLLDPSPTSWTNADLATGLARTYRWGGHSSWKRPLSVAQHSLTVLAIREMHSGPLAPDLALYELLHDAEEGLLGFDCIAPLKPFLGAPFALLSQNLKAAIAYRYDLPNLNEELWRLHKHADRVAAASEACHVVKWSPGDIRTTLELEEQPLESDPLFEPGYEAWEPWPGDVAAVRWLEAVDLHRDRRRMERKYAGDDQ